MTEIIINSKHGGFGISDKAAEWLIENRGWTVTGYSDEGNYRDESADLIDTYDNSDFRLGDRYDIISDDIYARNMRDDDDLLDCVKELGDEANGEFASLKIVEIPDDVEWTIEEVYLCEDHEISIEWGDPIVTDVRDSDGNKIPESEWE